MKTNEIWEYNDTNLVIKLKSKTVLTHFMTERRMECWKVEVLETDGTCCNFGCGLNIVPFDSLVAYFKKRYDEER